MTSITNTATAHVALGPHEAASSLTPATTATILLSGDSIFVVSLSFHRPASETRLSTQMKIQSNDDIWKPRNTPGI
ncbi:hypothetical protein L1887_17374 [Cichorium endivia]|nr:hypothetical protein L1887_17374 [Cichorium endivia]